MKQPNKIQIREVALRLSVTRNKFGARAYPVRRIYRARAPTKEN